MHQDFETNEEIKLNFEVATRVKLGEEHCWSTLAVGSQVFQCRKEYKKHELVMRGTERQREAGGSMNVSSFCRFARKLRRSKLCFTFQH